MWAVGKDQKAADREASLARRPGLANSIMKRVRRFCMGIRSLEAELVAFPVRIRKNDGNLIVIADLPGLKKEEVEVELSDSVLVIEVEPNREEEVLFRRAGRQIIPLPEGAGIDLAKAELKNGVLKVSLPVPHSREGRTVSVEEVSDIDLQQSGDGQLVRAPAAPVRDKKYAAVI